MTGLYLDEDTSRYDFLAALRSRGVDAVSSLEAGMNGETDEAQLIFAAKSNRLIITANAADFAVLHSRWMQEGRTHAGIAIAPQGRYSAGEMLRRALHLLESPHPLANGIYFLSGY